MARAKRRPNVVLTPAQLEERRLRAIDLLKSKKKTQAEIAGELGVTRQAVYLWWRKYREEGKTGLQRRPHTGRTPKLDPDVLKKLPDLLVKGAESHGFEGDVWTRERVANVIEKQFGVEYDPRHVGKLLHKLGLTWKKPRTRAIDRDDERIDEWLREEWPRLKNGRRSSAR